MPEAPSQPDPRLALIYAESVRRLDAQQSYLDQLRTRALTLLGIIAGATGLIGAVSTPKRGFDIWELITIIGFLLALSSAVFATFAGRFRYSHHPDKMLKVYVDDAPQRSVDDMYRSLAEQNAVMWAINRDLYRTRIKGVGTPIPGGAEMRRRPGPLFLMQVSATSLAVAASAWVIHLQR